MRIVLDSGDNNKKAKQGIGTKGRRKKKEQGANIEGERNQLVVFPTSWPVRYENPGFNILIKGSHHFIVGIRSSRAT